MAKAKNRTRLSGHASVLAIFVAGQLDFPWFVLASLAGLAVLMYTVDLWRVGKRYSATQKENRRREDLKLRVLLLGLALTAGFVGIGWYVHLNLERAATEHERQRVAREIEQERQDAARQRAADAFLLDRYRRFYENSEAPNKTTLIEMPNGVLKTRATNAYRAIEAMNDAYAKMRRSAEQELSDKKITKAEFDRREKQLIATASDEFERDHRVEARMILQELRNRIPVAARKHILGMPSLGPKDPRDGALSLYDILPRDFSFFFSEQLARELQELEKSLPTTD